MMEWFINDLSLTGQFPTSRHFQETLEPLLRLRLRHAILRDGLYCSRSLSMRKVTPLANLQQTVMEINDPNFRKLTLGWLGTAGPFWDDDRQLNENDYFECEGNDVTDQGLGEAARRKIVGANTAAFSFTNSATNFARTPLTVQHGVPEEILGLLQIENLWHVAALEQSVENSVRITTWQEVQAEVMRRFEHLSIPADAMGKIFDTPFSRSVALRIFDLLNVLNSLMKESSQDGQLSKAGKDLLQKHFVGEKAWFTDESETNKTAFRKDLTFPDPSNSKNSLFCPWHGKIKTPQTRIHFEWPVPANQRQLKVLFIGPKITKQ